MTIKVKVKKHKENAMAYLLWLDCEMTGLNPAEHTILELAVILTDMHLAHMYAEGDWIFHHPFNTLPPMDSSIQQMHLVSGLLEKVTSGGLSYTAVENEILALLQRHTPDGPIYLTGNSIHTDSGFIKKYLPRVAAKLHYRIVDISSLKVLIQSWYPHDKHAVYNKKNAHRAVDDINESINELKHYRKYFFKEV